MPSTSRRSLIAGAATLAAATIAPGQPAQAAQGCELSPLGRAFLALLPGEAEAIRCWASVLHPEAHIEAGAEAAHGRVDDSVEAILVAARKAPSEHLADLAAIIGHRACRDEHEHEAALLLSVEVLRRAGLTPAEYDSDAIYKAARAKAVG